jgi:hypothetical protein
LQYGQCEDTVYAMTIFCSSLVYTANDVDESYSLAQVTLLMMKNYNVDKLIPRVYGLIYGTVLSIKDTLQSTIEPLSRACHLTFSNAIHEHAVLNTLIYFRKCLYSGKKLPVLLDELASFTQKHVSTQINSFQYIYFTHPYIFRVCSKSLIRCQLLCIFWHRHTALFLS